MADDPFNVLDLVGAAAPTAVELQAGDKLFLAGEAGGRMFIVRTGELEVLLQGRTLERIGPGGIVGEMALVGDVDRSAAVLAASQSSLYALDRVAFLELVAKEPRFALAVVAVMAGRLRRANAALV